MTGGLIRAAELISAHCQASNHDPALEHKHTPVDAAYLEAADWKIAVPLTLRWARYSNLHPHIIKNKKTSGGAGYQTTPETAAISKLYNSSSVNCAYHHLVPVPV